MSPLVRGVGNFEYFLEKCSFLGPPTTPIASPIRCVLRGAIGRRPSVSTVRGARAKFTTCAIVPLARVRSGGSSAGSMRRRSRAIARPDLQDICMCDIKGLFLRYLHGRRARGLFGGFFTTMSASMLGGRFCGADGSDAFSGDLIWAGACRRQCAITSSRGRTAFGGRAVGSDFLSGSP